MLKVKRAEARTNRLLGAMEAASIDRIDPHLEPIELKLGAVVCDAGYAISARDCVAWRSLLECVTAVSPAVSTLGPSAAPRSGRASF
jgi:hypothetical protein